MQRRYKKEYVTYITLESPYNLKLEFLPMYWFPAENQKLSRFPKVSLVLITAVQGLFYFYMFLL